MEKIIPKRSSFGSFLRFWHGRLRGSPLRPIRATLPSPREGQQMHVIIVDNGRTVQLGREAFRNL
ncbi:MAG: hypothetical protein R2822_12935 [Spirosomataceae bacterium]